MATAILNPSTQSTSFPAVVSSVRGGVKLIDDFEAEWNELSDNAVEDQPFFRPDWIRAYLRTFEPRAKLLLVTARVGGRLALILPLIEEFASFTKVPLRRLRAPVNFCCSRFDAVRRSGLEGEAALRPAWDYLRDLDGWDLLLFRDALEGSTTGRLAALAKSDGLQTLAVPDNPAPIIPVPSDPNLLEKMPQNSKLRSQLRQIRIRLRERGHLRFACTATADPVVLDRFYRLEVSGWKARSTNSVLDGGLRAFYDEVAAFAARDGYFSLFTLELDGTLIAAHYCLTHGKNCYSPKVAYNEDHKAFAPGHLIMAEILRECCKRGIAQFDITGQDQPWKMKWTSETRAVNHHFVFKGRLGALAYAVGSRLKSPAGSIWYAGCQRRALGA